MINLIILFCALTMLLILEFIVNRREIFSVSFISTAVFTISVGYAFVGIEYFASDITILTVCVIIGAILAIFAGEGLANAVYQRPRSLYSRRRKNDGLMEAAEDRKPIEIKNQYIYFLFALTLVLGVVRYYDLYRVSLQYGNPHNLLKAIAYTRSILVAGELEGHRLLSYGCTFCMAAVYTAVFIYFYNCFLCRKRNLRLLLPMIAYLLIPLASTGRVEYIQYLLAVFTIFVICYRKSKGWKISGNLKILLSAIVVFLSFIFIFRLIGSFRDKWDVPSNMVANLMGYLSAGIYGLDNFLTAGPDYTLVFGYESLAWLYAVLNRFFGTYIPVASFQPFYTVGYITSNTYTGLKPFIQDFSIVGMLSVCFLLGFINTLWLNSVKAAADIRKCFLRIVGFSIYIYPMAMISVAGTFNGLLTTGYVLVFILLSVLNRFIVNPCSSNSIRKFFKVKENTNGEMENGSKYLVSQSGKINSGIRRKWIP